MFYSLGSIGKPFVWTGVAIMAQIVFSKLAFVGLHMKWTTWVKPTSLQKQRTWNSELLLGSGQSSAISLLIPREFVLVQVHVLTLSLTHRWVFPPKCKRSAPSSGQSDVLLPAFACFCPLLSALVNLTFYVDTLAFPMPSEAHNLFRFNVSFFF